MTNERHLAPFAFQKQFRSASNPPRMEEKHLPRPVTFDQAVMRQQTAFYARVETNASFWAETTHHSWAMRLVTATD